MNRNERIQLIKEFSSGNKTVEDLKASTKKVMMWTYNKNEGGYKNEKTAEVIKEVDCTQKTIESRYPSFCGLCAKIKNGDIEVYKIRMN